MGKWIGYDDNQGETCSGILCTLAIVYDGRREVLLGLRWGEMYELIDMCSLSLIYQNRNDGVISYL